MGVEPLRERIHTLSELQLATLDLIRHLRFQLQRQHWQEGTTDDEFISLVVTPLEQKIYADREMAKILRKRKKDSDDKQTT